MCPEMATFRHAEAPAESGRGLAEDLTQRIGAVVSLHKHADRFGLDQPGHEGVLGLAGVGARVLPAHLGKREGAGFLRPLLPLQERRAAQGESGPFPGSGRTAKARGQPSAPWCPETLPPARQPGLTSRLHW